MNRSLTACGRRRARWKRLGRASRVCQAGLALGLLVSILTSCGGRLGSTAAQLENAPCSRALEPCPKVARPDRIEQVETRHRPGRVPPAGRGGLEDLEVAPAPHASRSPTGLIQGIRSQSTAKPLHDREFYPLGEAAAKSQEHPPTRERRQSSVVKAETRTEASKSDSGDRSSKPNGLYRQEKIPFNLREVRSECRLGTRFELIFFYPLGGP